MGIIKGDTNINTENTVIGTTAILMARIAIDVIEQFDGKRDSLRRKPAEQFGEVL